MVALTAGRSALAGLYTGELLKFTVKLLNGPTDAVFMVGSGHVHGLYLVGKEAFCLVVGHPNAGEFQLAFLGHIFFFHGYASFHLNSRPA